MTLRRQVVVVVSEDRQAMDPHRIAQWRYEQIEELLDEELTAADRRVLLLRFARMPVRWPSGDDRPISEATLYRWLHAYQQGGFGGLMPARRPAGRGKPPPSFKEADLNYAISLLREEPGRSLTMLQALMKAERNVDVARSTLHRHLKAHPQYYSIRQSAERERRSKIRRRFQARRPHDVWQSDSKGPFLVCPQERPEPVKVHVFSILDDFSRAVLRAGVFEHANLAAAVSVFRGAARRFGLPRRFYADRASIFDSQAFRSGLAQLGIHRIRSRPKNAPARGKIEAYHRIIESWFVRELRHQIVHDLPHLNRLLTGVLQVVYLERRHRGIRTPPRTALGDQLSERHVSADRLLEAFLVRKRKKSHPKTGEVELGQTLFKVAEELSGRTLTFLYDPVDPELAFVEDKLGSRRRLSLALEEPQRPRNPPEEKRGEGRLQALYDYWRGRRLPQAEAGFGLPELFELLGEHLGRAVPRHEREARLIQEFYREKGPLGRVATKAALRKVFSKLGPGRPLSTYLDSLASQVVSRSSQTEQ